MEITNTRYYGLEESVLASGYPMLAKAPTEQELNAYRKAWGYIVD